MCHVVIQSVNCIIEHANCWPDEHCSLLGMVTTLRVRSHFKLTVKLKDIKVVLIKKVFESSVFGHRAEGDSNLFAKRLVPCTAFSCNPIHPEYLNVELTLLNSERIVLIQQTSWSINDFPFIGVDKVIEEWKAANHRVSSTENFLLALSKVAQKAVVLLDVLPYGGVPLGVL